MERAFRRCVQELPRAEQPFLYAIGDLDEWFDKHPDSKVYTRKKGLESFPDYAILPASKRYSRGWDTGDLLMRPIVATEDPGYDLVTQCLLKGNKSVLQLIIGGDILVNGERYDVTEAVSDYVRKLSIASVAGRQYQLWLDLILERASKDVQIDFCKRVLQVFPPDRFSSPYFDITNLEFIDFLSTYTFDNGVLESTLLPGYALGGCFVCFQRLQHCIKNGESCGPDSLFGQVVQAFCASESNPLYLAILYPLYGASDRKNLDWIPKDNIKGQCVVHMLKERFGVFSSDQQAKGPENPSP